MLLAALLTAVPVPVRADTDLPGRVARIADVGGELHLSTQERPDQWTAIGQNYPVTTGDNLWVGRDSRAEVDYGGGQFRLAADTNLHVSRLDDVNFAVFVAQGRMIVRVRFLDPGEAARIDTPNAQIAITRPGLYRIDVADDPRRTEIVVREGEANVAIASGTQQLLPGQTALLEGAEPQFANVRSGSGSDGFDTWSANRDRRYERTRATAYVSRQMVGYADLDEYGTWETTAEHGAVWYPSAVDADWAPYRNGYWTSVGAWGWTWVDYAPWGYAPFHYGRWAHIGGRWGWCPGGYVARPVWAPALVGWAGGPGWGFSATYGSPLYGWVPLGWGEQYQPWWGRCSHRCWEHHNRPYAVNVAERRHAPPTRYANWHVPGAITAVSGAAFAGRKPAYANRVNVSGAMAANAPLLTTAPAVRPDLGRIPGVRSGAGAPPPPSTFYPTAKPGGARGSVATIPATGAVVAVPPAARPLGAAVAVSPPAPSGARFMTKPMQVPVSTGASTYNAPLSAAPPSQPATPSVSPTPVPPGSALPARAHQRPSAPTVGGPIMSGRPLPAPVTSVVPAPAPAMRALPPRDRGVPLPPSMTQAMPAPQAARPIAAPMAPPPTVPMAAPPAAQIARPSAGQPPAQAGAPGRAAGGPAGYDRPGGQVGAPIGHRGAAPYVR